MQSKVCRSLLAVFVVCSGIAVPVHAAGQQLGMLIERVARGLPHSATRRARRDAEFVRRDLGWVLPTRPSERGLLSFVRNVTDSRVADAGPASLRVGLLPCPAELRHVVRDPADVVSVIGAVDLPVAVRGVPLELYLGLGVGPGGSYAAPSMTVNGQSGIAARMALGIHLELDPRLTIGAGVNAVGLFRAQRDVWATLAEDTELRGSTILPVHANLRLLL